MKYLVIFKRFEIWMLIAVVAALFVYVFRPEEAGEVTADPVPVAIPGGDTPPAGGAAPEEKSSFRVEGVEVTDAEGGRIVDVTLSARSTSGEKIPVNATTVAATTESGDEVRHFFEPFRESEFVHPDEPGLVTVRLWLREPVSTIWLDFQGERAKADLPDQP